MKTLNVDLGDRSYPIYIGESVLDAAQISPYIKGEEVVVITNTTVAELYLSPCLEVLSEYKTKSYILDDGEQFKNLQSVQGIYTFLLENNISRKVTLIALGGGVVGDITGFVAATYQRGVPFIQIPTTLLSQVDSSVGGKTGVNHALGKNMIGAFYQPQAVFAQLSFLNTLAEREYVSGMAEVIKYALIDDAELFDYLHANADALAVRSIAELIEVVYRSCENKARIVALDERESGVRALLNLGHTFGHAIEAQEKYQGLRHGEAVAVGMLMAADLSCRMGYLSNDELGKIQTLLASVKLPTEVPQGLQSDAFRASMNLDKKNVSGQLRLVLLKKLNEAYIEAQVDEDLLQQTLNKFITA